MTRIGINPARGKTTDYRPKAVTICVLTFIPELSGYFKHRLELFNLVFSSLIANTSVPHDLMVFDNHSCPEVVKYLLNLKLAGYIDYLILSDRNIGKIDALKILFNAAPGEFVAYNDDDVFFYPGWLEAHLDILNHFPQVGMVSGIAVRDASRHATKSMEKLASDGFSGLQSSHERYIPDSWESDWAASTGRDPQAHLHATSDHIDFIFRLEKPNESGVILAIASANHFQFMSPKSVILNALPDNWSGKLMGSMVELDTAVDNLGYLRLSTGQRFTRHLGNQICEEVIRDAKKIRLIGAEDNFRTTSKFSRASHRKHWLLRIPGSRRFLSYTYKQLFDILYQ